MMISAMPSSQTVPMLTPNSLTDLLIRRSESRPPRKLIFYSLGNPYTPTIVTYHDLYRLAYDSSRILTSLPSFREGCPVLLHLHDHWDVILWFWATILANGLPVLSTHFSNVDEHRQRHVQGLSTLLDSPICITRAEYLPLFQGLSHTFELHAVEALSAGREGQRQLRPASQPCQHANTPHDDHHSSKAAMLMLTSGSTGNAKAVVLTHRQVLASVAGKTSTLSAQGAFLNWIGLDHVGAFVEIHMHALWADKDQVHVQAADVVSSPTIFVDLLSRHRVSRSFAPNFFLASLAAAFPADQSTWDLSNLSCLVSGGEANDIKTCAAVSALLEKHGAHQGVIVPGFGMTETCAGSIYNVDCPVYDLANGYQVASLGKCIAGMEMRVALDQDTCEVQTSPDTDFVPTLASPNEQGYLEVRGEVVFQEYYRNPKATSEAFTRDGWFRTGDRAVIDSQGNLRLVGRAKEVINIHGVKVAISDLQLSLERACTECVLERLLVFPSRAAHSEQVTVLCLDREGGASTPGDMCEIEERLVQACMMITASRPVVFAPGTESRPLLPTTTLGKISRAKMSALFESGVFEADVARWRDIVHSYRLTRSVDQDHELRPDERVTAAENDLIDDFISIETKNSFDRAGAVRVDTTLWELGYSSMDIVRLKHAIDARLGLLVPMVMIMKNPTARSLAAAISRLQTSDRNSDSTRKSKSADLSGENVLGADSQYDPVVAFRTNGRKTPLWLVHPGVGEILVFVGLAQHLSDNDRPLYALRARGFECGETCFNSIDEAVTTYVAAIKRVQPRGPYALAGYSYGTMLAFEMAKRLDQMEGGTVKFLGSFNLPPHIKMRMRQLSWNMCLLHLAYFIGLTSEEWDGGQGFVDLTRTMALDRVLGVVDERRMWELSMNELDLTRWADVAYGLQSMAVNYEPTGSIGCIDIFHAEPLKVVAASRDEWICKHLAKWVDFCRSAPAFIEVDGAHYTMLGPEHVGRFAQRLKEVLKSRGV